MHLKTSRLLDALTDPRFPHYLPYSFLRRHNISKQLRDAPICNRVYLALTFDIESPFGSSVKTNISIKTDSANNFLLNVNDSLLNKKLHATFFVQGNLVKAHLNALTELVEKGNVLGLHGYAHELWGKPKWFIQDEPLRNAEKTRLLKTSIDQFTRNGLSRPLLFRAPNLVTDNFTLNLLNEYGFKIDSSSPSFRGVLPIPTFFSPNLTRIPVSSNPLCVYKHKRFIPYSFYQQLDLANVYSMNDKKFKIFLKNILTYQKIIGFPCHLVFLAHSWEFTDWNLDKKFSYCNHTNWDLIKKMIFNIEEDFDLKLVTMNNLNDILKKSAS